MASRDRARFHGGMVLAMLSPSFIGASPPGGTPIVVTVSDVRSAEGRVHVDICTEAQFLKDCPFSGEAPARIGTTIVTVPGVAPGRYAAQAFHDRNGNHKVDRSLFGIPTEGVGFSNDAKIVLAPPDFADAAFDHAAAAQRIGFRLRYFLRQARTVDPIKCPSYLAPKWRM